MRNGFNRHIAGAAIGVRPRRAAIFRNVEALFGADQDASRQIFMRRHRVDAPARIIAAEVDFLPAFRLIKGAIQPVHRRRKQSAAAFRIDETGDVVDFTCQLEHLRADRRCRLDYFFLFLRRAALRRSLRGARPLRDDHRGGHGLVLAEGARGRQPRRVTDAGASAALAAHRLLDGLFDLHLCFADEGPARAAVIRAEDAGVGAGIDDARVVRHLIKGEDVAGAQSARR